jgi:hypothetical protein
MDGDLRRADLDLERHERETPRWGKFRLLYSVAGSAKSRQLEAHLDTGDIIWTIAHLRQHIEQRLPLVPLLNIDGIEASAECGALYACGRATT